ncbi:MAG: hypothetical protein Q9181_001118 [Wetmoreana brouardii]
MAEILFSPGTGQSQPQDAKEKLMRTLDDLLERYLDLVHQYYTLQQSLAKDFSSGYFSLAQANFSNPNRVRYGQDLYDDRMQALTRFNIDSTPEGKSRTNTAEPSLKEAISVSLLQPTRQKSAAQQANKDRSTAMAQTEKDPNPPISDPLKWFGILVPPALRTSQQTFKTTVTETVPSLANISTEMKSLEIEIRRIRKKIRKMS